MNLLEILKAVSLSSQLDKRSKRYLSIYNLWLKKDSIWVERETDSEEKESYALTEEEKQEKEKKREEQVSTLKGEG